MAKHAGKKKTLFGTVIRHKMQKTAIVAVDRIVKDRLYKKYIHIRKKYKVHDERDETKPGDRVQIVECRPISKQKRWRVIRLLERPEFVE